MSLGAAVLPTGDGGEIQSESGPRTRERESCSSTRVQVAFL